MENLKRSIRFQLMESKSYILKFLSVLLLLDVFFYFLNNVYGRDTSIGLSVGISNAEDLLSVTGVNLLIILIALLVYNFERNYESFPLAISLSMTRKEYFASFLLDNVLVAFSFASIQGVLLKIDPYFVKLIGKVPLYDFLYFNLEKDSVFYIVFVLFSLFLAFICFWNLVASLNYKFGYIIWIIALAYNIILSSLNIKILEKTLISIGRVFDSRLGLNQFTFIFLGIGITYVVNYFIVIHSNIKGKLS